MTDQYQAEAPAVNVPRKAQLRVLICDDSAFLRVTLRKIIESDPGMRVVDIARNGAEAVDKALRLKPDVVTMDIHMPIVDGLTALKDIVYLKLAPVIMLASTTSEDATAAVDAMESGAFDFIAKPTGVDSLDNHAASIISKIKEAAESNIYTKIRHSEEWEHPLPESLPSLASLTRPVPQLQPGGLGYKAVVIGLSTGGPKAIFHVVPHLPAHLEAAVFVVQHMPPPFLTTFAQRIARKSQMRCVETEAGMKIEPGTIYVAKGGYHLKLFKKGNGDLIIRHTKEPAHMFMPAVDVAMNSVCDHFGADTVGVLMTGMGRDGALGMLNIARAGGSTIAENEETAIVYGMPKEAVKLGAVKHLLPNSDIADQIISDVNKKIPEKKIPALLQ